MSNMWMQNIILRGLLVRKYICKHCTNTMDKENFWKTGRCNNCNKLQIPIKVYVIVYCISIPIIIYAIYDVVVGLIK